MVIAPLIFILLIESSWSYLEDNYQLTEAESPYLYPEEPDDIEIHRRNNNNNFLRFGRNNPDEYEDYIEDFARPTRSGKIEKNDHFIRFGRGKQDFLRFGRDQHRRTNYLRFGRSSENKRNKREVVAEEYNPKRAAAGSNYLRFGRNSHFVRFGRNQETEELVNRMKQVHESPLWQLLNDLLGQLKQLENRKCTTTA